MGRYPSAFREGAAEGADAGHPPASKVPRYAPKAPRAPLRFTPGWSPYGALKR